MSPSVFVRRLSSPTFLLLGCAFLALHALAGPALREIKIDAMVHPELSVHESFSYEIRPPRPRTSAGHPLYPGAVQFTKTALSGLGLYEAPPGVLPDVTIEVDCGLDAPRVETRTRAVPVLDPRPDALPFGTSPLTFVTDNYQVSLQLKYLMVTARPRGSAAILWRVQAALDDESSDLESCLPLLAAAVMNQVGQDTRGTRTMKLSPRDTDVAFITQGMP
jgi:hypothetical protein